MEDFPGNALRHASSVEKGLKAIFDIIRNSNMLPLTFQMSELDYLSIEQ